MERTGFVRPKCKKPRRAPSNVCHPERKRGTSRLSCRTSRGPSPSPRLGMTCLAKGVVVQSSYSWQKTAENATESAPLRPLRLDCLRVFDQPNGGRKLWVLKSGGQSRHGLGMRDPRWNFKNFLSQIVDPTEKTAPASNEDSFADEIDEGFFVNRTFEKLEGFADSQMNDGVQGFAFDLLAGEAGIILQHHRFTRQTISENDAAFIDLQLLRSRHRDTQSHRNIVRDVIAADPKSSALLDRAVDIQNEIGCAAADIDNQSTEIFLLLRQDHLRRSQRGKDNVFHLQRQLLDTTNRVLNPGAHTVEDVKICFQFLTKHANGIVHAGLPIDGIAVNEEMEKRVLRWNTDLAGIDLYVLDVLFVDLLVIIRQHDAATIVKTLNVGPGHADIHTLDHDITFGLGVAQRFQDAFHRRLKIDNISFADPACFRLADAQNFR